MKKKNFIVILLIALIVAFSIIAYLEIKKENRQVFVPNLLSNDVKEYNSNGDMVSGTTKIEGTVKSGDTGFEKKDLGLGERYIDNLLIKDIQHAKLGEQNILVSNVKNSSSNALESKIIRIQIFNHSGKEIENQYSSTREMNPNEEKEWNTMINSNFEDIGNIKFSIITIARNIMFKN